MNDNSAFMLAEITIVQIEVEAMKQQNTIDAANGREPTYPPRDFFCLAETVSNIINKYR